MTWPDNGIAQRRLDGGFNYNMFVENDNGTWRAWVQSDMTDIDKKDWSKAKALEFFSGTQELVRATVDEELQTQEPGFVDSKGRYRGPTHNQKFAFDRGPAVSGLKRDADFSLGAQSCPVFFLGFRGAPTRDDMLAPAWPKVPLILDKSHIGKGSLCNAGTLRSAINTTLDLNDGTFLVTMKCWVFRLHKSDLSPVGDAPALRIVDGDAMKAAIDKAKGRQIEDATAYLVQALGLRFTDAHACMPMHAR